MSAHGRKLSVIDWELLILLLAGLIFGAGCTKAQLQGQSSVVPVLDQLSGASGATPAAFAGYLASDVLTYVKTQVEGAQVCSPTIFQDSGRATFHLSLKDPGTIDIPTYPSPANTITFTSYHVNYRRTDGRNTPGVDVPYPFDGGMQAAIVGGNVTIGQITLVRVQSKEEPPLRALINGGGARTISTIGEITFYGTDQAGRAIVVTGYINIDFSDWGDPDC